MSASGVESRDQRMLLCLDFDQSLVKGHFHHELSWNMRISPEEVRHNPEKYADLLIAKFGLKNPTAVCRTIRDALSDGHHIAITSFTLYPEIIPIVLKRMGLTGSEIAAIRIEGGFPVDGPGSPNRKNEHIEKAMQYFEVKDPKHVLLADDDKLNIEKAKEAGYLGVLIPVDEHNDSNKQHEELFPHYSKEISVILTELDLNKAFGKLSEAYSTVLFIKRPTIKSYQTEIYSVL